MRAGCASASEASLIRDTADCAFFSVSINARLTLLNSISGNCVRRLLPRASAVIPVLSEIKKNCSHISQIVL